MKYNIISINDDRKEYKDAIRAGTSLEEVDIPTFDANVSNPSENISRRNLFHDPVWGNAKRGELGVWLSNYDCWKHAADMDEPLVVFEDDAILGFDFDYKVHNLVNELPDDWDFAALWVPDNQRQDYLYDLRYEQGIPRISGVLPPERSLFRLPQCSTAALVYQGYGMVSLVYSPKGAQRLVDLAHEHGITGPVDCWIFEQAHMDNVRGFAPRPECADIVHYDWKAVSHVQLTERAL